MIEAAGFVLWLAACLGHGAILTVSVNWWYGTPLYKPLLRIIRLAHGLLLLATPVLFLLVFGLHFPQALAQAPLDWSLPGSVYCLACALVGLTILPAITIYRALRRRPAAVLSNHTETVDMAARLGYVPAGDGKYHRLVHLPGNQVCRVDFSERILRIANLPDGWDGLSILHLSDLHFCGTPDRAFFNQVIDICREPVPDLVALTGDFVDTDVHRRWIVPVLGKLRWNIGAFAVLGNHDYFHQPDLVRRRLRRIGVHVLGNTWEQLEVRGQPMVVIGHEGPWYGPEPDLTDCPPGFRFCLSHTPDNIRWARTNQIRLMLAGHNHGGQIRLPLIGSLFVPSRYSRRYDCGTFHEPPTLMHVSRGVSGKQPLRYNCRPEVTRIVLRK